jgi:predicted enzyme involved in methoxymalonyl-ACP biosynthesis
MNNQSRCIWNSPIEFIVFIFFKVAGTKIKKIKSCYKRGEKNENVRKFYNLRISFLRNSRGHGG